MGTHLIVLHGGVGGLDQVHLVLEDDDVRQAHDLHGRQVLRRLGLGTGFVPRDQKQCRVHDGRAVQHGGHLTWGK